MRGCSSPAWEAWMSDDLPHRLRTCAAYMAQQAQQRDEDKPIQLISQSVLDAAILMNEAADAIEKGQPAPDLGEPMEIIPPPPPNMQINRDPSEMWSAQA